MKLVTGSYTGLLHAPSDAGVPTPLAREARRRGRCLGDALPPVAIAMELTSKAPRCRGGIDRRQISRPRVTPDASASVEFSSLRRQPARFRGTERRFLVATSTSSRFVRAAPASHHRSFASLWHIYASPIVVVIFNRRRTPTSYAVHAALPLVSPGERRYAAKTNPCADRP